MGYQAVQVIPSHHVETRRVEIPATIVNGAAEAVHVVLRVGAGALFLQHGLQKSFGLFGGFMNNPGARAPLESLMGVAGIIETLGGLMIILGLFTRPVGLILAGEMVTAYAMAHIPNGPWPMLNGGELALLYAMVFLWLAAYGAGPLSIDHGLTRTIVVREMVKEPIVADHVELHPPLRS